MNVHVVPVLSIRTVTEKTVKKYTVMLKKGLILCVVLVALSSVAKAQEGTVEVAKDSLIMLLQEYRSAHEINPTVMRTISLGTKPIDKKTASRVKRKGFRVQIFSGSSRNEAYAVQSRFKNQYADVDSYINYDEPNYRVKVGDFKSRAEANNFMRVLRSQYSNVFVFVEDIWIWE